MNLLSKTTAIACLVASASAAATPPALRSRVPNPGQGLCDSGPLIDFNTHDLSLCRDLRNYCKYKAPGPQMPLDKGPADPNSVVEKLLVLSENQKK